MQNTKKLVVSGLAKQLAVRVYRLTSDFPVAEKFGITAQMRRAAVSIGSNIAEGCGKRSNRELLRYLYIASGSASELEFQLELAEALGFGEARGTQATLEEIALLRRKLGRLVAFHRSHPEWRKSEGSRPSETPP